MHPSCERTQLRRAELPEQAIVCRGATLWNVFRKIFCFFSCGRGEHERGKERKAASGASMSDNVLIRYTGGKKRKREQKVKVTEMRGHVRSRNSSCSELNPADFDKLRFWSARLGLTGGSLLTVFKMPSSPRRDRGISGVFALLPVVLLLKHSVSKGKIIAGIAETVVLLTVAFVTIVSIDQANRNDGGTPSD